MPVEMRMWRIDGDEPRSLKSAMLPSEAELEDFLAKDPSLLGTPLLVIGRQVRTPYNKYIDLLAMDVEGNLHVLELKRDKTPRDVVAQALDYGSWVAALDGDQVNVIANNHLPEPLATVFEQTFGEPLPDELNRGLELTIVATGLDSSSERIVTYARSLGVPINAVFFAYLEDDHRRYLARSWLVDDHADAAPLGPKKATARQWNERDWYVNFGTDGRVWADAVTFGFVSAGGGRVYSRVLRQIKPGDRLNVYVPGNGYVGIGVSLGEAQPFASAEVQHDDRWVRLAERSLKGSYLNAAHGEEETDDIADWVVPVRWLATTSLDQAFKTSKSFYNPNTVCRLKDKYTLEQLAAHFGVDDETT